MSFTKHWPSQCTKAKSFHNAHAQAQCKQDFKNVFNKLVSSGEYYYFWTNLLEKILQKQQ